MATYITPNWVPPDSFSHAHSFVDFNAPHFGERPAVEFGGYPPPGFGVDSKEDFGGNAFPNSELSYQNVIPPNRGEFRERIRDEYRPRQSPAPATYFLPWLLSTTLVSAATPRLDVVYQWQQLDFDFPSSDDRRAAIASKAYVPANNLPLGLEIWQDRIFVTLPRWKEGIPATLATIPRVPARGNVSPLMKPFPNWNWHKVGNCDGLTSVFRLSIDPCGRLWVLDSGIVDAVGDARKICPAKIVVFDLQTDQLLWRYEIPADQIKDGSLFTNIAVDVRDGHCDDAFAYVADVWRFAIVVYSWREDRSWRITHNLFFPDPIASEYSLHGLDFRWTDGIFGLALSPHSHVTRDRTLFFHPMSSYREFSVSTSVLRNETAADAHPEAFKVLGEPRGSKNYHSSASGMDRNGVLFYNLVTQDTVACWNSNQPAGYVRDLQGIVDRSNVTLVFPNDLKIDLEKRQSVWVLTNKLHDFLYRELKPDDVNFRILKAFTDDAVRGTVCEPGYVHVPRAENELHGRVLNCPSY